MKKRFTDCDRWDDPWYRSMSPSYKLLWEFILSKCDNAGVWKVDFSLARFMTNCEELTEEHALANFNEEKQRIHPFKKGYWFIPDFVGFQFGGFNGENNFHRQIRDLLRNYGLIDFEGQTSPLQGALEKEKEKDKEQEKEKEKEKEVKAFRYSAAFEDFWNLYPSRNGKKLLKKETYGQFSKLDEAEIPSLMQAVLNYKASGQMPKDGPRFFKNDYWREWLTPAVKPVDDKSQERREKLMREMQEIDYEK